MRRYGWSSGNIGANGHCVLLETEQTNRGSTSYLRQAQEDLSTDSCGENIRYQAVEGLVQNSRHQMGSKAHLLRSVSVEYYNTKNEPQFLTLHYLCRLIIRQVWKTYCQKGLTRMIPA